MAHSASARKRIRQNASRRALNRWRKGTMRDALKTFRDRMTKGTVEEAREAMREASALIDKTAQKGAVHKNAAARTKSRMSAALAKKESEAAA